MRRIYVLRRGDTARRKPSAASLMTDGRCHSSTRIIWSNTHMVTNSDGGNEKASAIRSSSAEATTQNISESNTNSNGANEMQQHPRNLDTVALMIKLEDDLANKPGPTHDHVTPLPAIRPETNIGEVGKLSAQAVAAAFEASARAIEEMAGELVEMGKRCDEDTLAAIGENERVKSKIKETVEACKHTAQRYRDEAKYLFTEIQKSSKVADEVRAACIELNERIQRNEPKPDVAPTITAETKT
jgi:uncharacterized protein YjbJ (UPF0337 family)